MAKSTLAVQIAALEALKGTGLPLAAATLILFTNNVEPTRDTVMADLDEATFNGYAAEAGLAFGDAYLNSAGRVVIGAPSHTFISTNGLVAETVQGWALVNAGKTTLYYAERLSQPVPITAGDQGVNIDPIVAYGD